MIPSGPFISGVTTLTQCPITLLDCRLNSRVPRIAGRDIIGNFLKVMTPDIKGPLGIIFDIKIFNPK